MAFSSSKVVFDPYREETSSMTTTVGFKSLDEAMEHIAEQQVEAKDNGADPECVWWCIQEIPPDGIYTIAACDHPHTEDHHHVGLHGDNACVTCGHLGNDLCNKCGDKTCAECADDSGACRSCVVAGRQSERRRSIDA